MLRRILSVLFYHQEETHIEPTVESPFRVPPVRPTSELGAAEITQSFSDLAAQVHGPEWDQLKRSRRRLVCPVPDWSMEAADIVQLTDQEWDALVQSVLPQEVAQ